MAAITNIENGIYIDYRCVGVCDSVYPYLSFTLSFSACLSLSLPLSPP